jgi:hypothetical protein
MPGKDSCSQGQFPSVSALAFPQINTDGIATCQVRPGPWLLERSFSRQRPAALSRLLPLEPVWHAREDRLEGLPQQDLNT